MAPTDLSVHCPGCGSSTVDHGTDRTAPARWACVSLTCPFRHGWRLEPAALHQLDQVDGDNTVYAIPLNPDTTLNLEHAVLWPSILASAGRVLLGTERQAA